MSIFFHLGHESHSLVKAFVKQRYSMMARSRIKQEYLDSTPSSSNKSAAPLYWSRNTVPSMADYDLPDAGDPSPDNDTIGGGSNEATEELTDGEASYESSGAMAATGTPDTARSQVQDEEKDEEDAMQAMGTHSRDLIKVIQKLDSLSIESSLPSLPKFIVVGDQSAGKSSIIEALCDISLPRSEGTCTKCPFHITTSRSKNAAQWSCTISLHHEFIYERSGGLSGHHLYEQWARQDPPPPNFHFATIHERNQLEDCLKRAQLAILTPGADPSYFANVAYINPDSATPLAFSPNTICLEIEGPDLPELDFTDLPGAINVAAREEEQYTVKLVETLMKSKLKDDQALVLLACSADQDVDNSTAFRFVRDTQAKSRCMGVLTKPDLAQSAGRIAQIGRILGQKDFQLGLGWFVTKQLSQQQIDDGIRHADARRLEQQHFDSAPWNKSLGKFSERFGISKLQNSISHHLTQHILSVLPEIIERVNSRLDSVTHQLSQFPEQPRFPTYTVMSEVQKLCNTIGHHVEGKTINQSQFRVDYKALLMHFGARLNAASPDVDMKTPGYIKPPSFIDVDEISVPESRVTPGPGATPPSSKKRKTNNPSQDTPRQATLRQARPMPNVPPPAKTTFKLESLKQLCDAGSGTDIPGRLSPQVSEQLILETLSGWTTLVDDALRELQMLVCAMATTTLRAELGTRRQTKLYDRCRVIVEELFAHKLQAGEDAVRDILACEQHKAMTLAHARLRIEEGAFVADLQRRRLSERVEEHFDTIDFKGQRMTGRMERLKKQGDLTWVQETLGTDPYEREVLAMAIPMAYYKIAAGRFVDSVATQLQYKLMSGILTDLERTLLVKLEATNDDACAALLAEDPERERQRTEMLVLRAKLIEARDELSTLPGLDQLRKN